MKNTHILIDTNIVLDLVQKREPYSENASKIINSCVIGENIGYFSAHSLSDLFFILRKFFTIISEREDFFVSICNNSDWDDLEDGLQIKCAESEHLDYIITRDKENGFKNSPVRIISPEEFLKL